MTDFRALCAELHAAFNTYAVDEAHHDLLVRARAALAQPEPQGPTDEEPREMWLSLEWFNEGATFREFASIVRRWGNQ